MVGNRSSLLAALVALAVVPRGAAQEPVDCQRISFRSAGRDIRLELFAPRGSGRLPALVLVPESKSLEDVGVIYRSAARLLAEEGYLVSLVHYFDRTGHKGVDPKNIQEEDFRAWMATVADAFRHTRSLDRAKPGRTGMLGFSLGGFLALSAASDKTLEVKAVASYFGGIPEKLWPQVNHLPPTLLIHGRNDDLVCVRHCYTVKGFCDLNKIPHECQIYNDGHMFEKSLTGYVILARVKHLFDPKGGVFQASAAIADGLRLCPTVRDAVDRGVRFFDKHVKTAVTK